MLQITFECGGAGFSPRIVRIVTDSSLSEILADDFLQSARQEGIEFKQTDSFCISYLSAPGVHTTDYFSAAMSADTITLFQLNQTGYTPGQICATSTNDNAAAGKMGQYIEGIVAVDTAVELESDVSADVTIVTLTAGDWDVCGTVWYDAALETEVTSKSAWVSSSSELMPTPPHNGAFSTDNLLVAAGSRNTNLIVGNGRFSLAETTTLHLSCSAVFTGSTCKAYGIVRARRVR